MNAVLKPASEKDSEQASPPAPRGYRELTRIAPGLRRHAGEIWPSR